MTMQRHFTSRTRASFYVEPYEYAERHVNLGIGVGGREGQVFAKVDLIEMIGAALKTGGNTLTAADVERLTGRRVKFLQDRPAAQMSPMNSTILRHLNQKATITAVEAAALYGCRALPRRIADLKELGYAVRSEHRKAQNGQRYVRYFIEQ